MAMADQEIPNEPPPPTPDEARPNVRAIRTEKVPPHDIDLERSLVGAMLLTPAAATEALDLVAPEDFYQPRHQSIVAAIAAVLGRGEVPDVPTTVAELRRMGLLDEVGGPGEVLHAQATAGSPGRVGQYAAVIGDYARARKVLTTAFRLREAGYAADLEEAASIVAEATAFAAESSKRLIAFEDVGAVVRGEVDDVVPAMLRREDGQALIYPGLSHWIMGEHGKGKTWVALYAVAEQLNEGRACLYLDWEGNRRIIGARLRALGVEAETVDAHLLYGRPSHLDAVSMVQLAASVVEREVALVVCDGLAVALARQGLNEDKAPEVLSFLELVVHPLTEAGAAVLVLDHVAKDKDGRGLWARGSGAKMGEVSGAAWTVRPSSQGFSRFKGGHVDLVQAKDREGYVGTDGSIVARVHFTPDADNGTLDVTLRDIGAEPAFRPTGFMERISRELEAAQAPMSKRTIRSLVSGRNGTKDLAIEHLESEGFVQREGSSYRSVKPFRDDTELVDNRYEGGPDDDPLG